MGEHEGREGERKIILQDPKGPPLSRTKIGDRILYSGYPGTILHELAYLASMPEETQRPNLDHDPASEQHLQREFIKVVLPWYQRVTQ